MQRGDVAVMDKFTRAKLAVESGVDLVIELPVPYAVAPAEVFALGGVALLSALPNVTEISFGSECGDLELLRQAADACYLCKTEYRDVMQDFLKQGHPYPDVERANVVVVMIDATEGITEQDAKIAGIAHENGKGVIIAVNKWDAIEKNDKTIYQFTAKIRDVLAYMPYAEIMFISAQTGQRLSKLFDMIDTVLENQSMRVGTGVLNEIMTEAVALQQPPSDKGKRLKLYYITQVAVKPPTFVIFVNDKELMHFSYTRYIENKIRESFGFKGTPLRFIIRERKES